MSWLETIRDRLTDRVLPAAPVKVVLPESDSAEEHGKEDSPAAEGQTFIIEYRDAQGQPSVRRVTVWDVDLYDDRPPILCCYCHERRAVRHFRTDRIRACIDYDGEVHDDVAAFLSDALGLSASQLSPRRADAWPQLRALIRPHAHLLAALARSDGLMGAGEVGLAAEFCCELAEGQGFTVDAEIQRRITDYLKRCDPPPAAVIRAIDEIRDRGRAESLAVLGAGAGLMDCDGSREDGEIRLINEIARDLVGMDLV